MVPGELEKANLLEAKLRGELEETKDMQLKSEKQHRKMAQQLEEQKHLEVSSLNQKLEEAVAREEGFKQTIGDLRTREATIQGQIVQLKDKVDDCGRIIEEQVAELKERAEGLRKAKEEVKAISEGRDKSEQMVCSSPEPDLLSMWHLKMFVCLSDE